MTTLLAIEDDMDIRLALETLLTRRGYAVATAESGAVGLRIFHERRPDLVLLDIGLPGMDGWQVLERIRDLSSAPVLMLTALGSDEDIVRGLRMGADDYVTKPFSNAQLVARIEALLRRAGQSATDEPEFGDDRVVIRPGSHSVLVDGQDIALSPLDFRLLSTLMRNSGQVLTARQLLRLVWDDSSGIAPERVKFAVLRLRRKLGWHDISESPIESVRGLGYRYIAATRVST